MKFNCSVTLFLIVLHCLTNDLTAQEQKISLQSAYQTLGTATPIQGIKTSNPVGLEGRVMAGYQGWFRAPGDGSKLGFHHYSKNKRFKPGFCTIDLWPDLSEFDVDEKFPTPFRFANGQVAHVFSSIHPKTVDRHFKWMKDYEMDGVFVQRFAVHRSRPAPRDDFRTLQFENLKLSLCRDAAMRHQRAYALMYDLTGMTDSGFDQLADDWKQLRKKMELGTDPNDTAYLHVDGKPLVAVWGIGFNDKRKYSLKNCERFIRLLKNDPEWGGMSVMVGVPYYWRQQINDTIPDPNFLNVLKLADVISPWSVGRYQDLNAINKKMLPIQIADREWCEKEKIDYLPVLYPGFSWANLTGKPSTVPRLGGKFFWQQFSQTYAAGNRSAYIAMFDEIDEGTAIFKCTNHPPVGKSKFADFEGLPSDHYLWLCQQGRRLLNGVLPAKSPLPTRQVPK